MGGVVSERICFFCNSVSRSGCTAPTRSYFFFASTFCQLTPQERLCRGRPPLSLVRLISGSLTMAGDGGGFLCGACVCFVVIPAVILIILSFSSLQPVEYGLNFNVRAPLAARSCAAWCPLRAPRPTVTRTHERARTPHRYVGSLLAARGGAERGPDTPSAHSRALRPSRCRWRIRRTPSPACTSLGSGTGSFASPASSRPSSS